MRLFLDANVLFTAAHNAAGRSAGLFALARQGRCALMASAHAIEEARRNLRLKYPEAETPLDALCQTLSIVPEAGRSDVDWAFGHGLPIGDAAILAAAIRAKADLLVTGDRAHFGSLYGRRLRGVEVVSPAEALERILG